MYILIYYIIVGCFILSVNRSYSQTSSWINHIGGNSDDLAVSGQCDMDGNYFLFGTFYDGSSCHFPPDTSLICNGYNDAFLAKFNSSGEGLWAQRFGGYNPEGYAEYMNFYYDSVSGYLYLAGHFYGGVTFGGFSFQTQLHDIIIAKYTLDGNCVWAKKYGGDGSDLCYAITLDGSGNIYICGKNYETVNFGPDTISKGGFIAKFDPEGNCIWAKKKFPFEVIIQAGLYMTGLATKDSVILLSGCLYQKEVFTIDTITINHPGLCSSFIILFDKDGAGIKVMEGIAGYTESFAGLANDQLGNSYLTGQFYGTIIFDTTILTSPTGQHEMFLVKYDKDGELQWARQAEADMAEGSRVFSDHQGYTYVAGIFSGNASFGGQNVTSFTSKDAFIARYDPSGQCLGVQHWGNSSASGITEDPEKNPVVVLSFTGSCTVGDSTFVSYGESDILVFNTTAISGTNEITAEPLATLRIYANPTTGKCTITIPEEFRHEEELTLFVYDSRGRLIQQAAIQRTSETYRLDIQAQASGVYQAVLTDGRRSVSGRIVFKR